jgi:hypothetical protein
MMFKGTRYCFRNFSILSQVLTIPQRKELLKYTSNDHPDYPGLSAALKRAEEIATMADDTNTRLAKTFFNMHKSIDNCPVSTSHLAFKL